MRAPTTPPAVDALARLIDDQLERGVRILVRAHGSDRTMEVVEVIGLNPQARAAGACAAVRVREPRRPDTVIWAAPIEEIAVGDLADVTTAPGVYGRLAVRPFAAGQPAPPLAA